MRRKNAMFEDRFHIQKFVGWNRGPAHIIQPHVSKAYPQPILKCDTHKESGSVAFELENNPFHTRYRSYTVDKAQLYTDKGTVIKCSLLNGLLTESINHNETPCNL